MHGEANICQIVLQDWKYLKIKTESSKQQEGGWGGARSFSALYSPSGGGCSLGSEAGTSAGQHLLPPPAVRCSPGLDSGDGELQARAAGWPEGSGRSC